MARTRPKVLLTGMTSTHTNPKTRERYASVPSLVYDALTGAGWDVDWRIPEFVEPGNVLTEYDHVVVGIAPPLSVGATHMYATLSTLASLWESPRLTVYMDAPDPKKIQASARSILLHPEQLTKPFFSSRRYYRRVNETDTVRTRLLRVVGQMVSPDWPRAFYPALPWELDPRVMRLPLFNSERTTGVMLDSLVTLPQDVDPRSVRRRQEWLVEHTFSSRWARAQGLTWDQMILPRGDDAAVVAEMAETDAVLIPPHQNGLWWSQTWAQALLSGAPIASVWKVTQALGEPWSVLPSAIESMTMVELRDLAAHQRESYFAAVGDSTENVLSIFTND